MFTRYALSLCVMLSIFAISSPAKADESVHATPSHIAENRNLSHADCGIYIVKSGDTLSQIAPSTWQYLHVPSGNPNLIYPNDRIDLCDTSHASPSPVTYTSSHTYPNIGIAGWCMWYAFNLQPHIYVPPAPNPVAGFYAVQSVGGHTGYSPQVGALAVFWPYVQGASSVGHMAYVEAVYNNGSFLIAEMSNWHADERVVWSGSGVAFIYE